MLHYYSIPGIRQFRSKRLTVPYSAQQLLAICPPKPKAPDEIRVKVEELIEVVCNQCGVSYERLMAKNRQHERVFARQLITFIGRRQLRMTCTAMARTLGQDHTTVVHNTNTLQNLIDTDPNVLAVLNNIERSLQLPLTTPTNHQKSI